MAQKKHCLQLNAESVFLPSLLRLLILEDRPYMGANSEYFKVARVFQDARYRLKANFPQSSRGSGLWERL